MKAKKEKTEKKITFLLKLIRKIWLKYVDSLDEKGNEIVKEEGYLSLTVFRRDMWFNSYVEESKMREEDNIDITIFFKEGKNEVEDC